ncbi:MAG: hypothetical protein IJ065_06260 [Eubacterium sp.]|nr:hypothetical protein [Eubacterium sp.]
MQADFLYFSKDSQRGLKPIKSRVSAILSSLWIFLILLKNRQLFGTSAALIAAPNVTVVISPERYILLYFQEKCSTKRLDFMVWSLFLLTYAPVVRIMGIWLLDLKGRYEMKTKVNISLDADTAKKMKELAENSHKNVSQWVSDKVWETAKKEEMEQARLQKLKGTE